MTPAFSMSTQECFQGLFIYLMGTGTCNDCLTCFVYNRFVSMVFCTHRPLSRTRAEMFIYLLFLFQTFWDENGGRRHKIWERTQLCSWPLMWRIKLATASQLPSFNITEIWTVCQTSWVQLALGTRNSFIVPEWWQTEYTVSTWIIIISPNL